MTYLCACVRACVRACAFLSCVYGTSTSFHSTLSYPVCIAPSNHFTVHFPPYPVWHLHIIPQYTFLSCVYGTFKSFHNALSYPTRMATFSTAKSFHSTLSYFMCMTPPNYSQYTFLCYIHGNAYSATNHSTKYFSCSFHFQQC